MIRRLVIFGTAAFMLTARVHAHTWTNTAGHSFEATALEIDGQTAVFERPSGEKLRMPLFSLSTDEQRRIQEQFYGPAIPADLQSAYAYAAAQLERARLLRTEGQIDEQAFADRHAAVLRSLKQACAERGYAEESDEVQQLVTRLTTQ